MPLFRLIILVLLVAGALSFLAFAVTGRPRYRSAGIRLISVALIAALGFFAVLILERLLTTTP